MTEPRRRLGLGAVAVGAVVLGLVLIGLGIAREAPTGTDGSGGPSLRSSPPDRPLAGLTLVLDPGHNGGNAADPARMSSLVPDGRGSTKACNTTGTTTAAGYPEHAFNWDVAVRAGASLESLGAVVLLTRDSDDGMGPCVDARGRFGQENGADAVVSIHANGSEDDSRRGFFAILSEPPLNPAQGAPSHALADALLVALDDAGFTRSTTYLDGFSLRSDLAGLNHAERPAVLLELGEMRNLQEAAVMSSEDGRQRYADAIAAGVLAWATAER